MKVCVLGLDGATWDVLDPWLDDLPTLRSFAEEMHEPLDSCIPPLSVPAWKCYSTGLDPGQLGVYTFVDPDVETERFETVSSETFTHREIWDYLGESGHRSAVINMPSTSPPREIPGYLVGGPFADDDHFAEPPDLQADLAAAAYTIIPEYYLSRDPDDVAAAVEAARHRLQVASELSGDVDFLHVTLYIIDTVQHVEFDSPVAKELWEAVDALLAEFLATLDDEWNVVLMSDHGFGRTAGRFYLNSWLEERGYLDLDASGFDFGDLAALLGIDYQTAFAVVDRLRLEGLLRRVFPAEFLLRVARQMPGNRRLQGLQNKVDWDSAALALPPLIYTADQRTAAEIREELLDVRAPDGQAVVEDVFFGRDLYPNGAGRVPDLIVKHGDWDINPVFDPGTIFEANPAEGIIAHHRRNGVLSARGPDVDPDAVDGEARLFDLAPTILDGFGVDRPADLAGSSLGLFGSAGDVADVAVERGKSRVVDHDERVERQLEDLGYL